ncbi:MAG: flippase-like domain-containing protein [Chitinophagaceae bacterium]|nr:flippase-like domain-containing protein [Chitinophagaceae bacterium]
MTRKKLLNALQYIFFLGLGVFLLWLSARGLSPENKQQLVSSLKGADYLLVLLPMLILLLAHYTRALRWKILIQPLGYSPSSINTFFATMLGYFFNMMVPRLGEVMKCTMLAKYEKIPADKLIGTMVTERIVDALCLLIVFAITIVTQFNIISGYASAKLSIILYDAEGNLKLFRIALILLVSGALVLLFTWILKRNASSPVVKKIFSILKGIWAGITSIAHLKNKWLFIAQSILIWVLYILSVKAGFYTMQEVKHLDIGACFSIISLGSVAMIATPGGIGAYQYFIQELLPLYGIAKGPALGFGWILWLAQTGIAIFGGLICLILLPLINRNKHEIPRADKK